MDVIENKISSVRKYLGIPDRYKKYSRSEIENNVDLKGALERYLYLAIQATIDLAEAFISYKKYRKPSTLSESFSILHEENMLSSALTDNLIRMTGFRNVIAHDYESLDYDIVFDVLQKKLFSIEEFITRLSD